MNQSFFVLFVLGICIALPAVMIWGWVRWAKHREPRTAILDSIVSGIRTRHRIGTACNRGNALCPCRWRVFFLRPCADENLSLGSAAFRYSNGVRNHRSMATEFSALARPCLCRGNSGLLASGSSR